ncbi:MAG: hypothetical protein ACM3ME_03625 [Chloroflexota bacterium]
MKKLNVILLLAVFGVVNSCYHEPELSSDIPLVCFKTEVLPVIQSSCVMSGCHDGGEEFFLGNYDAIVSKVTAGKPMASELHKAIAADHNSLQIMPPKPNEPLSRKQLDKISLWILQGAQNTSCDEVCDSVNVTFTADVLPIMETYCKGCHSGSQPRGKFLLTDYPTVKAAVEGGRMMGAVRWQNGYLKMPENGDQLSACNIAILQKWINLGMLDN